MFIDLLYRSAINLSRLYSSLNAFIPIDNKISRSIESNETESDIILQVNKFGYNLKCLYYIHAKSKNTNYILKMSVSFEMEKIFCILHYFMCTLVLSKRVNIWIIHKTKFMFTSCHQITLFNFLFILNCTYKK